MLILNIKNAFIGSHLTEDIYLTLTEGVAHKMGHVLKALRSLYGLEQASRDWDILIKEDLIKWVSTRQFLSKLSPGSFSVITASVSSFAFLTILSWLLLIP